MLGNLLLPKDGRTFQDLVGEQLKKLKVSDATVIFPEDLMLASEQGSDDVTLSLTNIRMIDTSKATWQQILELRRDSEMVSKLRNLRLFLSRNYEGRSKAFIEDDLCKLLEDYERARKVHGFDTKISMLSQVFSSKFLQVGTAAALAFAVAGQPLPATLSGVSAGVLATFELAKVGIELIKGRHTLRELKASHDLAYIIEAKQRIF